ncbi:hypothetical protein VTN77DRAFT_5099 [Rasamsonia byssochlamydoides]|uniref:uncharacterized protein n=1 Tax=Rasamsonia byssochlamydoides TaxID=89139 RepID=UPI00374314AC
MTLPQSQMKPRNRHYHVSDLPKSDQGKGGNEGSWRSFHKWTSQEPAHRGGLGLVLIGFREGSDRQAWKSQPETGRPPSVRDFLLPTLPVAMRCDVEEDSVSDEVESIIIWHEDGRLLPGISLPHSNKAPPNKLAELANELRGVPESGGTAAPVGLLAGTASLGHLTSSLLGYRTSLPAHLISPAMTPLGLPRLGPEGPLNRGTPAAAVSFSSGHPPSPR